MRVPTPRLRQVFEHTTHFKVTRPGRNPIVIAKKSLSPKMISRLQAFAKGGEVGHYAKGVEVGGNAQQDAELAKIESGMDAVQNNPPATEQPVEEEIDRSTGRRVFTGVDPSTVPTEAQDIAAEQARIATLPKPPPIEPLPTEVERARLAASMAPAAPAPAPVVVNVNAAPAAPAEKPAPEAEKPEAKKPIASEDVARQAALDAASMPVEMPSVVAPEAPAPALVAPPSFQLTEPTLLPKAKLGLKAMPGLTSLDPSKVYPLGVDIGRETPVSAETLTSQPAITAPAAVAPTVAPEAPAGLALGTATTGKAVSEAMSKGMTLPQAVAATTGVDIQHLPFTPTELKGIEAAQKEYGDTVPKMLVEAAVTRVNGAIGQARASEAALTAEREQLKAQEVEAAAKAKSAYDAEQAALAHAKELRENAEKNADVRSFFQSQGMASSVLSLISLAIGGALSGYTGTPNYVLKAFNNALERDLEEQKRRINSRWSLYKDATGSAEAATALYKADNLILTDIALKRAMANQNLEKVGPQLQDTLGKLEEELALNLSKFSSAAAREDYLEKLGAAAGKPKVSVRVTKGAEGKGVTVDEAAQTLNIAGEPIRAATKTGLVGTQRKINGMNSAVREGMAALQFFNRTPIEKIADITSAERADAIARLAFLIETFPTAFGFERAISLNAAKQLKEGLQSPTGLKAIVLQYFPGSTRDIQSGLRTLVASEKARRRSEIEGFARPTDEGKAQVAKALQALKKQDDEEVDALLRHEERPLPAAPVPSPLASSLTTPVGVTDIRNRLKRVSK